MAYIWPGIPNGSTSYPSVIDELGLQVKKTVGEVEFLATNLLDNSDFHAGTEGWISGGASISASEGIASCTGNGAHNYPYMSRSVSAGVVNHKYYFKAMVMVDNAECTSISFRASGLPTSTGLKTSPTSGVWYYLSTVYAAVNTSASVVLYHNYAAAAAANNKVMQVQYVFSLDLTERFGAGNEPTAAEMDAIMSYWPNSWFDGTANLAQASKMLSYLLSAIRAKADKAQEAWIVPTLLNGFTNLSGMTTRYCKDTTGFVHVEVYVTGDTSAVIFGLPPGYRPTQTEYPVGLSTSAVASLAISANGNVTHNAGTVSGMLRFMFDFRAA